MNLSLNLGVYGDELKMVVVSMLDKNLAFHPIRGFKKLQTKDIVIGPTFYLKTRASLKQLKTVCWAMLVEYCG